ncbi:MAG: hypothetical protein ACOYB3_00990 [Azonexus sp.]
MKIKKVKFDGMDSFNDYQVELSYGQLVAVRNALEAKHDDPLSDELYAEINYYLQNIPGPGESSDAFKQERDMAKKTKDEAGQEIAPEDAGAGGPPTEAGLEAGMGAGGELPAPPEDEMGGMGGEMGGPEGPGGQDMGGPEDMGGPGGEPGGFKEGPKLSPEEREIIDRAVQGGSSARPTGVRHGLPRPPAE